MARTNLVNPDEALAGMARIGSPRQPVGKSVVSGATNPSADAAGKVARPHGVAKSTNPTAGGKANKKAKMVDGAAYGISATINHPGAPEAGCTTANGRLFTSSINRTRTNFDSAYSRLA